MYTQYGVREICDVVFKAKANMTVGNRRFFKGEPVIYFDALKTSTLEGAATTVYATGGRGNSRLIAWEGERTVTFTMEDALISPVGFMLLSGAGLINAEPGKKVETIADKKFTINAKKGQTEYVLDLNASEVISVSNGGDYHLIDGVLYVYEATLNEGDNEVTISYKTAAADAKKIYQHITATIAKPESYSGYALTVVDEHDNPIEGISNDNGALIYVYPLKSGKMFTEPFLAKKGTGKGEIEVIQKDVYTAIDHTAGHNYEATDWATKAGLADAFLVDFYIEHTENAMQIEITADSFGGNFYIEASTLFRDTNGVDYPAEFIIPNAKVQSNFTFSMASSGDPSTFTFTCDAFPDYTRFNRTKKVIAALQVITGAANDDKYREATATSLTF